MKTFKDIIGHDNIKEHFKAALESGKISHAYIFSGEEGSGKKTVADIFAAALMCGGEEKPCGGCMSCMQAESRNHPDIIYVTHEKSRMSVEEIRTQIVEDIIIRPFNGGRKVYIVDEADRMTEQAQNALLKTIEEPPEYAVIILLTANTGAFLQTILSRCVTLQFKPLSNQLISEYLMKNEGLPDYYAGVCASFSGGSLGRAIRYAKNAEFEQTKAEVLGFVKNIDESSFDAIMNIVARLSKRKEALDDYLDLMHLWFRDVLMFKATQDVNRIIFIDETMAIRKMAARYSFEGLGRISEAFGKVRDRLRANVNFDTAMQLLLLSMRDH